MNPKATWFCRNTLPKRLLPNNQLAGVTDESGKPPLGRPLYLCQTNPAQPPP